MKKVMLLLIAAGIGVPPSSAQGIKAGDWNGLLSVPGMDLPIKVRFDRDSGELGATIDIPAQNAYGLRLQNVSESEDRVRFELPSGLGMAIFDGSVGEDGRLAGDFTQGAAVGTFYLDPPTSETEAMASTVQVTLPVNFHSEEATVDIEGGTSAGTIVKPISEGPFPIVVIIAGSGPTDRDGNSAGLGPNNSLKMLAESLANLGLASARYDKRGIGASANARQDESSLRIATFVDDAVRWCRHVTEDEQFSRVVIAGHSEGSLIGMLAAEQCSADAFVSIAGVGRPADALLREQLAGKLPPDLAATNESILAALTAGNTVEDVPQALQTLYRPAVQPYLISWIRYDPAEVISGLEVPALVVQGTTDIQISVADAERLATSERVELEIIEGMNHVLKDVEDDQAAQLQSYSDAALPINATLAKVIADFVNR